MTQDEKRETPLNSDDLIWITAAIVKYGRSRGWFQTRLANGRLHQAPQLGTNRVYLHKSEIEQAIREEARG